jgi:probable rRNA maturation factor
VELNSRRPLRGLPAEKARRIAEGFLERAASGRAPVGRIRDGVLSLTLCGDGFIRAVNRKYLGRDEPTDVIAFSFLEGGRIPGEALGEVIVSTETAARQAPRFRTDAVDEVLRLLAHGILHVFGYEHTRSGREGARMRRAERRLLRGAGRG